MTLHNAKGLEYDTVFIVGCEDGAFPHMRALEEGGEEEERRLCYVGITRARRRLYMTWARERRLFGRAERNLPSRFIDELPAELTERHCELAGRRRHGWERRRRRGAGAADRPRPGAGAADRRRRRPRQLRRRRRHRGRAGRGGRRPLRRRRHRAQADGRLRPDPEAVSGGGAGRSTARRSPPRSASGSRADVAAYAAERGRTPALATVLVGDDPASEIYVAQQAQGLRGGRDALGPPRPRRRRPARTELLELVAELGARRRRRRHPRPAAGARPDRPRPRSSPRSTRPRTSTA